MKFNFYIKPQCLFDISNHLAWGTDYTLTMWSVYFGPFQLSVSAKEANIGPPK